MTYQPLNASSLVAALQHGGLSAQVEYHKRIDSTNLRARQLVNRGDWTGQEALCVVANYQFAGRGRRMGAWHSPPGDSLLFTLVEPISAWEPVGALTTLSCALAVAETLDDIYGLKAGIKWPNDVRVRKRKICGILVERAQGPAGAAILIGIGVNANQSFSDFPEPLRGRATSVAMECGHPVDRMEILTHLVAAMAAIKQDFRAADGRQSLVAIRRRLDLIGEFIRVEQEGAPVIEGAALGIERDGALVVRQSGGLSVRCLSGTVVEFEDPEQDTAP